MATSAGGQIRTKACPTIRSSGTAPKLRESSEFPLLSPMTKTWSSGIVIGPKSEVVDALGQVVLFERAHR